MFRASYVIALGSNQPHHRHGKPAGVIRAALDRLEHEGVHVAARSPIIATPPMGSVEQSARWVEVCTRVHEEVVEGRGGTALRSYAGVNPAEFFAVATEAFLDDPVDLRRQQPDLYAVLGDYYHQDPAARHR